MAAWFLFVWLCTNIGCIHIATLGPMNYNACEESRDFLDGTRFNTGEWVVANCREEIGS
jgi:hypothetical protein